MRALRSCSAVVWLGWLLLQVCTMTAPLVAAAADRQHPTSAEELCVCPMDDGAACPMHRDRANDQDPASCTLRSTCTPLESAVLSLQFGPAVLPERVVFVRDAAGTAVDLSTPEASTRPRLPDLPPPRV